MCLSPKRGWTTGLSPRQLVWALAQLDLESSCWVLLSDQAAGRYKCQVACCVDGSPRWKKQHGVVVMRRTASAHLHPLESIACFSLVKASLFLRSTVLWNARAVGRAKLFSSLSLSHSLGRHCCLRCKGAKPVSAVCQSLLRVSLS
jgi:hypothetical protein